jgi:S-adenosylmethionine-diacylglycerol 3-amino-3-carboxypropyl transferase
MEIHYAQCWEDPEILMQALNITARDDVLSIASGGDNSFALLLNHPKSLTAIDKNPAQLFLVELKMRAIQEFDFDDFIGFIGVRPCQKRRHLYAFLRARLGEEARGYWDMREEEIEKGVIHSGRFERYFSIFRRMVLPLIHSRKTVREFLSAASLQEQQVFYDKVWSNWRWRCFFRVFFGKLLLGHLGRDPSFFRYVTLESVGKELLRRTRRGLTEIPISSNYFVEYILTGRYCTTETAHPYLRESNFQFLKEHIGNLQLICSSLEEYLTKLPPESISKFNLSDIFEYMSDGVFEMTLREILRVAQEGSKLTYWTLFVPRPIPPRLTSRIRLRSFFPGGNGAASRTFFYGSFCLGELSEGKRSFQGETGRFHAPLLV